jgi:hypothetical protein
MVEVVPWSQRGDVEVTLALNDTASAPTMPVREPCGIIHKTCLSLMPQGMPSESGHAGWPSAAPRPNCSAGAVDAAQHRHVEAGYRAAEDSAGVYAALDGTLWIIELRCHVVRQVALSDQARGLILHAPGRVDELQSS